MIWRSLRLKLAAIFSVVAISLVGFAGVAVFELRELEHRVVIDHVTTTMFDLVREVRNRENRLFLFRRSGEYKDLLDAVDETTAFLAESGPWPTEAKSVAALAEIRNGLREYRERLGRYWRSERWRRDTADAAEEELHRHRRLFVDLAEYISKTATERVREDLAAQRWRMASGITLLVLIMVGVAQFLTRRIVRPLKEIENQMQQVAAGRIERVEFSWPDRELVSLAGAFNHVMSELDTRQARAMQAEKLAALGTMLSGVAHELNNPLSNISTTVQILGEEAETLSIAESRRLVERIDQQTERARNIVRSLLEYSRADGNPPREVDAFSLVESAIDAINHGRQTPRRVMVDGPRHLVFPAHVEHLRRALINLLDNAIAASDDADPIVVLLRSATAADGSSLVEITLQDCGSGVSPTQRAQMFDPFYTTKPVGVGTGLGLYITHEIIKQHGGDIDVRSVEGGGTSIIIRLPATVRSTGP